MPKPPAKKAFCGTKKQDIAPAPQSTDPKPKITPKNFTRDLLKTTFLHIQNLSPPSVFVQST